MSPFKKIIPFKVVKTAEEPEMKPAEAHATQVLPEDLGPLQVDWSRELFHGAHAHLADFILVEQDGRERAFYVLQRLPMKIKLGEIATVLRVIRDDLRIFQVTRTCALDDYGFIAKVVTDFEEITDPRTLNITADRVLSVVKAVIKGETPPIIV